MKPPQLLHSTRSYGRANSTFSWKLPVLERGFLSCRQKLSRGRSERDAWFGYSPVGALRKSPFILCSRLAEDWLQRSGSSSTISPTTLFFAISARGRRNRSRSSTRRGFREYATTPASIVRVRCGTSRKPRYSGGWARHIEFGIPQIYSRISGRFRRQSVIGRAASGGPLFEPERSFVVAVSGDRSWPLSRLARGGIDRRMLLPCPHKPRRPRRGDFSMGWPQFP